MNILQRASKESGIHQFDLILGSIDEVDEDVSRFISAQQVMSYCRNNGAERSDASLPRFVVRYCYKIIAEHRQLKLI